MRWGDFAAAAPELAALGEELFDRTGLCIVGTLRRDGSPRISPCEIYIVDGEVLLGMMWQSKKALDLQRDSRVAVHSTQCDREATEGDFKAYGRAVDVPDSGLRARYGDVVYAKIDWRPEEPYHLFALDLEGAGYMKFGSGRKALRWNKDQGLARIRHPDDGRE